MNHEIEESNAFDVEFRVLKDDLQCCLPLHTVGLQMSGEPEIDILKLLRLEEWVGFKHDLPEVVVECTLVLFDLELPHGVFHEIDLLVF